MFVFMQVSYQRSAKSTSLGTKFCSNGPTYCCVKLDGMRANFQKNQGNRRYSAPTENFNCLHAFAKGLVALSGHTSGFEVLYAALKHAMLQLRSYHCR